MARLPEDTPRFLQQSLYDEEAKERQSLADMDRIRRRKVIDDAKATLERLKPLIHEIEMQQILAERRDRNKRIHAKAKRLVARRSKNDAEADLVYRTLGLKRPFRG